MKSDETLQEQAQIRYVAGFRFSEDLQKVALIRKQKPLWQKGLLNGVGGKLEPGEDATRAMEREFFEEAGADTQGEWTYLLSISDQSWMVHVFFSVAPLENLTSPEEEQVELVDLSAITANRPDLSPGLSWIIPLALEKAQGKLPRYVDL